MSFLLQLPRADSGSDAANKGILKTLDEAIVKLHGRAHLFTMQINGSAEVRQLVRMHGSDKTRTLEVGIDTSAEEMYVKRLSLALALTLILIPTIASNRVNQLLGKPS